MTPAQKAWATRRAQRDLFAPPPRSGPVPFSEAQPGLETYFVSGSNHAGEIRGLLRCQMNVGVCAPKVGPAAERELLAIGENTLAMHRVFVDSGAFGEVSFMTGRPVVTKPITDAAWKKVLGLYLRLGKVLGHQLYCVAPDQVGSQVETMARLERYAPQVRELLALGVNVIVPLQRGERTMAEFAIGVVDLFGTFDLIWGVPSKKGATDSKELARFADWLSYSQLPEVYRRGVTSPDSDPVDCGIGWIDAGNSRVHLLGLGPSSPRYREVYDSIRKASPLTTIFSDSVRITALVGKGEFRKDGSRVPRALTAARAAVIAEGKLVKVDEVKAESLTRVMTEEWRAQVRAARRGGWYDDELESAPGVPLEEGCINYGPGGPL